MELEKQRLIFAYLREYFDKAGVESKIIPGNGEPQVGDTIMMKIPVAEPAPRAEPATKAEAAASAETAPSAESAERFVLMEIMAAPLDVDTDFIQLFSTWVLGIGDDDGNERVRTELLKIIPHMNLYSHVGFFGIDDTAEGSNFYHKYTVLFSNDTAVVNAVDGVLTALAAIYDIVGTYFPLISKMNAGEIDYAAAKVLFT